MTGQQALPYTGSGRQENKKREMRLYKDRSLSPTGQSAQRLRKAVILYVARGFKELSFYLMRFLRGLGKILEVLPMYAFVFNCFLR